MQRWKKAYEALAAQVEQLQRDKQEAATERDLAWKTLLVVHYCLEFTDLSREEIQAFVGRPLAHWNLDADPLWREVIAAIEKERERRRSSPEGEAAR